MTVVVGIAPGVASAALTREVDYQGTIAGTVFGQPFQLPVAVTFAPPLPDEPDPLMLALGTVGADPNTVPGYLFMRSAVRIPPPFALTLTQMPLTVQGNVLRGTVTQTGAGTTAVSSNGFTAPNVCDIVEGAQAPLLCVTDTFNAEQFYFLAGSQVALQVNGPTVTGQVTGQGNGLVQILPYPPVIYTATLTATLVAGQPLNLATDLAGPAGTGAPTALDRTPPSLRNLRITTRRASPTAATVRVHVSEPATVTATLAKPGAGLALGPPLGSGICQAPTPNARRTLARTLSNELAGQHGTKRRRNSARLRRRAACALVRTTIARKATRAGNLTLSIARKTGGRTLADGRYRLTVRATDLAGNSSAPHSATLTIRHR